MSWEVITAIAEVLGAIAVLVTLLYLARQIKLNTEEVRSSNYHGITDSFNTVNLAVAGNSELARIFRLGNEAYDELTDDEKTQFGFFMHSAFRVMDVLHYQSRHGTGDKTLWDFEKPTIDTMLSSTGSRKWWRARPYNFSEDFAAYVESNVLSKYDDAT
jgi:hypothetical protein